MRQWKLLVGVATLLISVIFPLLSKSFEKAELEEKAVCTAPVGGSSVGVVDCGNVSVVTVNPAVTGSAQSIDLLKGVYDTYRNGHTSETLRDFVAVSPGNGELDLEGYAWKVSDPIQTTALVGVAATVPTYFLGRGRGFWDVNSVYAHEIAHYWGTLENNGVPSFPAPRLASGTTTAGGTTGLLTDQNGSFTSVQVGDYVVFPVSQGTNRFKVTAKTSTTLSFGTAETILNDPYHDPTAGDLSTYCPVVTTQTYAPASGVSYFVESWDLISTTRQCAHWSKFVDTNASYLDGIKWTDNGNGTFTSVEEEVRFSPWDLYMMGLIQNTQTELPALYRILNPNPNSFSPGRTVSGTKRSFTLTQMLNWKTIAYNPKTFRFRTIVATVLGTSVAPEEIEKADQSRRDFVTYFQDQTLERGKLSSVFDETKPDLVVAQISAPEKIGLGQTLNVTVRLHNQGNVATGGTHVLKWETPWTSGTTTVAAMSAFEIKSVPIAVTIPSTETGVFSSQAYRGSIFFKVTTDFNSQITEGDEDHNIRQIDITWAPSVGNRLTLTHGQVRDLASDGDYVYAIRQGTSPFNRLQKISFDNPINPTLSIDLDTNGSVEDVVATPSVIVLARSAFDDNIDVLSTPLGGTYSPVQSITGLSPKKIAISGSNLYVARASGVTVVTGVSPSGGAQVGSTVAYGTGLPTNPPVKKIVVTPNGQKLFVLVSKDDLQVDWAIEQYSITGGNQLAYVRRYDFLAVGSVSSSSTIVDFDATNNHLYVARNIGAYESYNTSTGAIVSQIKNDANRIYAVKVIRDYVFFKTSAWWSIFQTSLTNGTLTRLGSMPMDLQVSQHDLFDTVGAIAVRNWAILADDTGIRVASPTSVTNEFIRGDSDGSGVLDITDGVRVLNVLFSGASYFGLQDAFDANDSESIDISDGVRILNFLFTGGEAPAAPFPNPGVDPSGTALGYVRPR